MRLLPARENWRHRLFATAYVGELIGTAFGVCAIFFALDDFGLAVKMIAVSTVHIFLVWAWGRRYRGIDAVYVAWSLPSVFLLARFAQSAVSFIAYRGWEDGPAIWGLPAIIIALVTRLAGVYWSLFGTASELRESAKWPAGIAVLGVVVALALFVGTGVAGLLLIEGSFYGFRVQL